MDIEKKIKELEKNLSNEPIEYNGFITPPSIVFQDNFKELMKIIQVSNLLPSVLTVFSPVMIDYLEKEYNSQKDRISIQASGEITITQENKEPIIESVEFDESKLFASIRQSFSEIPKEFLDVMSQNIARLNSYYFLALYAYLDIYSTAIYDLIISKLVKKHVFKLKKNFNKMSNPKVKISTIRGNLLLNIKYGLIVTQKLDCWKTTLRNLLILSIQLLIEYQL